MPHPGNPCPRGLKQWRGKTLASCLGEVMALSFRFSFRPSISVIVITSASLRHVLLAHRQCHVSPLVSCMLSSQASIRLWEASLLCGVICTSLFIVRLGSSSTSLYPHQLFSFNVLQAHQYALAAFRIFSSHFSMSTVVPSLSFVTSS